MRTGSEVEPVDKRMNERDDPSHSEQCDAGYASVHEQMRSVQLASSTLLSDDAEDDSDDGHSAANKLASELDARGGPSQQQLLEQLLREASVEQLLELAHDDISALNHRESDDLDANGDEHAHSYSHSHSNSPDSESHDGTHEGALPFIADDVPTHGLYAQEMENALERATFGFTQVEPEASRAMRKRSSLVMVSTLAKDLAAIQLSMQHEIRAQRKKWLKEVLRALLTAVALLEALYVLVSVPLRIGFHLDPLSRVFDRGTWTYELTIYSALDIAGEVARLVYVYVERESIGATFTKKSTLSQLSARSGKSTRSTGRRATRTVMPQLAQHRTAGMRMSVPLVSLFSVRDDDQAVASAGGTAAMETASVIQDTLEQTRVPLLLKVFLFLHLDLVAAICFDYTWIHLARAVKLVIASYSLPLLYASVTRRCRQFQLVRLLSFSTLSLPFELFCLGLYLCHVSACGYMLIAHIECGVDFALCSRTPVPGCWVLKDRLERGSFWRQYVRTMYWASKTITTLGQGDLVPTTQLETDYCIVVQFISGLWATAFLSSCSFYFSRRDADVNECASTRLEQALKFLRNRHVPSELAAHIRAYHQYLQRTRNGIEENRILADLPVHYHTQCSSYVTMRLIRRVPFFAKQPKAFMKTVLAMIESDFLSPNQTIIGVLDLEELLIVARGEIRVLDIEHKLLVQTIETGQWYAEHALFQDRLSRYELVAGTFCEVYCLSKQSFTVAMEKHFPRMKIALLQAQYMQRAHLVFPVVTPADASGNDELQDRLRRTESLDRRLTHLTSVSKKSYLAEAAVAVPWRFPNSRFRHAWRRWKVALTIYLAIEVPFDTAFDWRFGVLGTASYTWRQYGAYFVALLVEVFFYVDVYLRAREFVRSRRAASDLTPPLHKLQEAVENKNLKATRSSQIRLHQGLIVAKSELLQYYLTHGDVLLDFVATLPISMVWTLLPKETVAFETMYYMRFFRLLALVRLTKLKKLMRKIMQDHDFSPASQLLTNVIVFCVISANAMGCLFFLLADVDGSDFGVPPGFAGAGSISADRCLEDASVFGNCTWYMYDLSTFNIHARYIRSLHWSVVLLSTVGYGDILSFSDSECFISFWWILLGALICYFTACAVSSVLAQVTVIDTVRSSRTEAVNRALVQAGVSSSTRRIIRRHFETNWALNGSVLQESELRQHLPRSQRYELACSLYLADLCRCYLFTGFRDHSSFLRDLTLIMRSEVFVPKVVLLNCGHLADEMYLIQSGDVEVLIPRVETRQRRYQSDLIAISEHPSTRRLFGSPSRQKRHATFFKRMFRRASFASASGEHANDVAVKSAQQRARRGIWEIQGSSKLVPIAVMRRGQCFGEESLLPHELYESRVSVRTVTSTQVAVLTRDDVLALFKRYPEEASEMHNRIMARRKHYADLFRRMNSNFSTRDKLKGFLGTGGSLYAENKVHTNHISGPETLFYQAWRTLQGCLLLYNFFQITFRIAFLPSPSAGTMLALTLIDYAVDALLFADIYLKWNHLGFTLYGDKIVDTVAIRQRYRTTWFRLDCLSMLPLYYYGDDYFVMTLCRLPRLLRTPQLLEYVSELEEHMRKRILRSSSMALLSVFDLFKFLLLFLSAAHQVGSIYYTIGRLIVKHELAPASWITADLVLNAYPHDVAVHYMRSLYWCLGTFTVVCFGDVVARNTVETFYSGCACVIGWVCIGQVMGKITSLMAVMDQDQHEHNERVEAFEQYAKKKRLPSFLRERSIEGLEFKSKCLIDLNMAKTFRDLPKAFHVLLFDELYGDYVRNVPELRDFLDEPQLQALANALRLELYLPEDLIIEEGRVGSKLFIMRNGAAEIFSAHSQMIFAAVHEGVLFGDLAFFLVGTKHLVSVRASRSCQVLYIHHRDWLQLWSDATRASIESKIVPVMKHKYRSMSRAFLNIFKNFELAKAGALSHRRVAGVKPAERDAIHEGMGDKGEGDADSSEQPASLIGVADVARCPRSPRSTMCASMEGSRRKLSAHLGLPLRAREPTLSPSLRSSAVINIEEEWKRHERNLKALALTEQQHQQQLSDEEVDAVCEIPPQASSTDADTDTLVHKSIHKTVDSAAMDSDDQLPSRVVSDRVAPDLAKRAETAAMFKHVTVSNGLDVLYEHTRRASHGRVATEAAMSKRHSIQIVNQDLRQSLATMRFEQNELSALAKSIAAQKLLNDPNAAPATQVSSTTAASGLAIPMPAFESRHRHHLPAGVATASVSTCDSSHDGAERDGHSYTKHLETLRARSKARKHQGVFQRSATVAGDRNPYDIWVEPSLPPAFCMENSSFRHLWNVLMLAICWYYILIVPFRISFDFEFLTLTGSSDVIVGWFAVEYLLDALCIADFVLQRSFFTYIFRGEVVTDKARICQHYWQEGSYLSDLVCILPFEALAPLYSAVRQSQDAAAPWDVTWYRVAVFRTNKMLRITRLHELSEHVQRTLVYDWKWTFITPSAVYFARFAFDFVLGAHWVACFFYAVSYNTFIEDGRQSWLTTPGMLAYAGCSGIASIGDVPVVTKFARSYHFSIGAITTVSYGDIVPQNAVETLLGTGVIVVSIVLFGMLAGGFFHLYEMELGQRADYEERVARVANYMVFHGFHARIWRQLQVYFAVHWQESKGMDEHELLRGLPTSVRQDIILFVKREFVVQMKLFATCEEAFVRAVVTAFEQELYVRHDVIIAEGDMGRSLYVIENGSVLVRITKKKPLLPRRTVVGHTSGTSTNAAAASAVHALRGAQDETLELVKGRFDFFGEKSLILDVPRSATCIALSSCSMLLLAVDKYREILDDFPEYRERNMREWLFANSSTTQQRAHS